MGTDYKTEYSRKKNFDTMEKGVFNDFGDGTPAKQVLINKLSSFSPPKDTDAITVEYPSGAVEVYRYRQGGTSGTILNSVTVTYNTSAKKDLISVEVI
jgi:hypothetical protein